MKRKQEITAKQIARMAKVSPATVSRALNPNQCWRISREKREEIRALSRKYAFTSRSARKVGASVKTFRVAMLLGTMERDLIAGGNLLIRLMCDILQQSGYILELIRVDFSRERVVSCVRNILRSEVADVYVIGGVMLKGQSLEFLRRISSRIILLLNMDMRLGMMNYPEFHWLSYFTWDSRAAYRQALENIPERFLSEMLFFGRNSHSVHSRLEFVRRLGAEIGRNFSRMEVFLFGDGQYISTEQDYHIVRREIAENYPYLSRFKSFFGADRSAYALYDELILHGKVPERDFHMITFQNKSSLFPLLSDKINFICRDIDQEARILCEQILSLVEDPTPRKVVCESVFLPVAMDNP